MVLSGAISHLQDVSCNVPKMPNLLENVISAWLGGMPLVIWHGTDQQTCLINSANHITFTEMLT